jgi:FkbM family methyltransferase
MTESIIFPHDNSVVITVPKVFIDTDGNNYKWFECYKYNIQNNEKTTRSIVSQLMKLNIIEKERNIIDSGAFIGDNSLPWAKQITGIVYAIDPSLNNELLIKHLCSMNNIQNIIYYRNVLSNNAIKLTYNGDLDFNSFSSSMGKQTIDATSLDILYNTNAINNISFIHLDVEGEEYKTLLGSIDLIKTYKPIIIYEQHILTDNIIDCINLLDIHGYTQYIINERSGARNDCRNLLAIPAEKYTIFLSKCSYLNELIPINPANTNGIIQYALDKLV